MVEFATINRFNAYLSGKMKAGAQQLRTCRSRSEVEKFAKEPFTTLSFLATPIVIVVIAPAAFRFAVALRGA